MNCPASVWIDAGGKKRERKKGADERRIGASDSWKKEVERLQCLRVGDGPGVINHSRYNNHRVLSPHVRYNNGRSGVRGEHARTCVGRVRARII